MSTRAESRPRVLLVHANPFQQVMPVPPYGLERIRTAAADTGAEIEIVDPYLVSDRPLEAAAEAARRMRPAVVGLGVRVVEDCIVVDDSGGADDRPFDLVWFMPELLRLRRAIAEAAPDALFLLGGAAFSAMPRECLDYLDVEHGVVGDTPAQLFVGGADQRGEQEGADQQLQHNEQQREQQGGLRCQR